MGTLFKVGLSCAIGAYAGHYVSDKLVDFANGSDNKALSDTTAKALSAAGAGIVGAGAYWLMAKF